MSARSSAARLPREPGVYRFRDRHGRILYLGRATDLRGRVRSYWGDLRDRRHLAGMVAKIARVEAVACGSVHEAAWPERNLLEAGLPAWNRSVGGAETFVHIVADTRPRTAGVRTSHTARFDGVTGFGPYLGGTGTGAAREALTQARDRAAPARRPSGPGSPSATPNWPRR